MARSKRYAGLTHLKTATTQDLRTAVSLLRARCPLPIPVKIRMDLPVDGEAWGECEQVTTKGRKHFVIRLMPGMPTPMMEMVLMHEWAHALDWRPTVPFRTDHAATFGVHWAEVYRAYHGTG